MYLPGVAQGNHVVDVNIGCVGPCGSIVGALPCSRRSGAVGSLNDVGAVTCENNLAGVALAWACQLGINVILAGPIPDCVIQWGNRSRE